MGLSHSFVAARGVDRAALLQGLGLAETMETGDVDVVLGGFGLTELKGGWLLVGCDDFDLPQKGPLAMLSEGGEIISCAVEEHVMVSEARGFAGGAQTWRVTHDPEEGIYDVQVEGEPPKGFAAIRDKILEEQRAKGGEDAGCDYVFDVPPRVAENLCGFFFGESEGEFTVLRQVRRLERPRAPRPPGKSGFFARLFGRA